MKSDKEIIKILAKHILKHYEEPTHEGYKCKFCYCTTEMQRMITSDHRPNCPVLLAEEVLTSKVYEDVSDIILNDSCVGCPFGIENKGQDLNIWCKEGYKYPEHGICFTKVRVLLKPETVILQEPLIVHNVMKYKGEYYLKQISNKPSCEGCSCFIDGGDCAIPESAQGDCGLNTYIWKSFKDIQITDELACMRRDIGDIYVYNIQEAKIDKLMYVEDNRNGFVHTEGWRSTNDNMRLATTEEIQEYLNK